LEVFAAKITGPPDTNASFYPFGAPFLDNYLDQAGYRVSFNGFDFATGDRVAATQHVNVTPGLPPTTSINPLETEIAAGQLMQWSATLRIEDLTTHQPQYLFIRSLDTGQLAATLVH